MGKIWEYVKKKWRESRFFREVMKMVISIFVLSICMVIVVTVITKCHEPDEFEVPHRKEVNVTKIGDNICDKKRVEIKKVSETDLLVEKIDKKILKLEQQQKRILKIVEGLEKIEEMNQQNLKIIEKLEKMEAVKK